MVRFLSPEWTALVNRCLDELPPSEADGSLAASGGRFTVCQVVHGAPGELAGADGEVVVTLQVTEGRPHLEVGGTEGSSADVVLSLDYHDAVALQRGELDPSAALAGGRVRVRGDLSVLVVGQRLLAAAAARLHELADTVTY
jgi:hypothetical protein